MRLRPLVAVVTTLAFSAALFAPGVAAAQTDAQKLEARDRFDRGLRLFNEGDNAGALAEFKRAYEIIPNPILLLNIGLTYAAMSRPVDAVDAFDKLLSNPGTIGAERLARAKAARDEQSLRIAELVVTVNVPDAALEVDNVEVGRTPLKGPLRVSSGTHIVGAVAPGYSPARKEVTVAGKTRGEVKLDLVAMQGRLAHLDLKTHLPGADVVVDGEAVAKTPLSASLTLSPGGHKIEVRRAGYRTAKQDILLGDGATGDMTLDPEIDDAALSTEGGTVALAISESQAVVKVDAQKLGLYAGPLRLPRGPHHLEIERGGFYPVVRDVTVEAGKNVDVVIALDPTPDTRADYVSTARAHRLWGIVGVAAGAALATGGGVWLAVNSSKKASAQSAFDAAVTENAPNGGGRCDFSLGYNRGITQGQCQDEVTSTFNSLQSQKNKDVVGYVGLAAGGALVVTGVVVLLTGNDPSRYDRRPAAEKLAWSFVPFGDGRSLAGAAAVGAF